MANKRFKKQEKHTALANLLTVWFMLIALAIDVFAMHFLVQGFEIEAAVGAAITALFLVSLLTGIASSILTCIVTRKSHTARRVSYWMLCARLCLLMALGIVLVVRRCNVMDPPLQDGPTQSVTTFVLGALTALGLQAFVCTRFLGKMLTPPAPRKPHNPTKHIPSNGVGTASSPSTTHTTIPSDGVKNTDFYKQKYDEYYARYTGTTPPSQSTSSPDDDDHDYSHIFKDTNW